MKLLTITIALVILFTASVAVGEMQVTYLGDLSIPPFIPVGIHGCGMGNFGQPAGIIEDERYFGQLYFASTFNPNDGCLYEPDDGFVIEKLFLMVAKMDEVPTTYNIELALADAYELDYVLAPCIPPTACYQYSVGPQCLNEGIPMTLEESGYYLIEMDIPCGCVSLEYANSIVFSSQSWSPGNLRLVRDGGPMSCPDYTWNSTFFGACVWPEIWGDGNAIVWIETSSCFPPVQEEPWNWGNVKALYR